MVRAGRYRQSLRGREEGRDRWEAQEVVAEAKKAPTEETVRALTEIAVINPGRRRSSRKEALIFGHTCSCGLGLLNSLLVAFTGLLGLLS